MDRWDICCPRARKDGKTYWVKIGAAFRSKSGDGLNLIFDALPVPDGEGRVCANLFKAKPRDDRPSSEPEQPGVDLDDEIPF